MRAGPVTASIALPTAGGGLETFTPPPPGDFRTSPGPFARVALAAAHVVADPRADADPWPSGAVDWDSTIRYREHLWGLGLGVAEAMDTAQRGTGLGWEGAKELVRRSVAAARPSGALVASGVGTDHLPADARPDVDAVIGAYEHQMEFVEGLGGRAVLMASRALAACASGPDDYLRVYDRVLSQAREPVIVHWLGAMFDPALEGYWGHAGLDAAMDVCLSAVAANAGRVDGVKVSLLDRGREVEMRRRLPAGVRMYTGDDLDFPELIAGDGRGHSDALLGIFDAIAPAASAALGELTGGRVDRFHAILGPAAELSRHIFRAPTRFYKTGLVLMAHLNGHQGHFTMLGGQESARSVLHLSELFRLAARAGLLRDPGMAVSRMRPILATHGIR